MSGAELKKAEYQKLMRGISRDMAKLGELFKSRNVFYNNLMWSLFSFRKGPLYFYSNIELGTVLQMQIVSAFLTSKNGTCGSGAASQNFAARFDQVSRKLTLSFPIEDKGLDQTCPQQGNWISYPNGISKKLSEFASGSAEISFDMRSALTAIALNLNFIKLSSFLKIKSQVASAFALEGYIDPLYSIDTLQMVPVWCLDKSKVFEVYGIRLTQRQLNGPPVCLLVDSFESRSLRFFYPWINQLFYDENVQFYPGLRTQRGCTCPRDEKVIGCNVQERLFTAFFYDLNFDPSKTVIFGLRLLDVYLNAGADTGDKAIIDYFTRLVSFNEVAFDLKNFRNASSILERAKKPITSFTDPTTGQRFDNSWSKGRNLYQLASSQFDEIGCPDCGAIIFQLSRFQARTDLLFPMNEYGVQFSDLVGENTSSSETITVNRANIGLTGFRLSEENLFKYLQGKKFPYIMCKDSLSQHKALAHLSAQPPVPLINTYYSCRKTWRSAILNSVGSSSAAANLIVIITWILVGWVFRKFFFKLLHKDEVYPTESRLERVATAEKNIEREVLVGLMENLRDFAESVKGLDRSATAASNLSEKIAEYSQLFKRTEGEARVIQARALGERVTQWMLHDDEDDEMNRHINVSIEPSPMLPTERRKITLTLTSQLSYRGDVETERVLPRASRRFSSLAEHPLDSRNSLRRGSAVRTTSASLVDVSQQL